MNRQFLPAIAGLAVLVTGCPQTPPKLIEGGKESIALQVCALPAGTENFQLRIDAAVKGVIEDLGVDVRRIVASSQSSSALFTDYSEFYRCAATTLSGNNSLNDPVLQATMMVSDYYATVNRIVAKDTDEDAKLEELAKAKNDFLEQAIPSTLSTRIMPADRDRVVNMFPKVAVIESLRAADISVQIPRIDVGACGGAAVTLAQPVNGATLSMLRSLHSGYIRLAAGLLSPKNFALEQMQRASAIAGDYIRDVAQTEVALPCALDA